MWMVYSRPSEIGCPHHKPQLQGCLPQRLELCATRHKAANKQDPCKQLGVSTQSSACAWKMPKHCFPLNGRRQ